MGALSYLLITAILFLIIEPYKNNRFIRFHSFQALFFAVVYFLYPRGHLCPGPPIKNIYIFSTQTQGRPGRVHGHVSSA